jgi:membrane peptidoglycan carboxypeptidase
MLLGKRLYLALMFVLVSVLGGVLAAGMLAPAFGTVADTARTAVGGVSDLPAELEAPPQWQRSKLLNGDGSVLTYFYEQNRQYVTIDKIAPIMREAQVAIEDHRFYEHGAMDLTGTLRALVSTSQGNTQGGSSITQQYVRMVLVEKADAAGDDAAKEAATENTVARKIRELRYAIAVEKEFSKDQILEFFLNMAYYGDGAYGVEAAARHYFNTSAAKLTLPQAAMLAGLVRNPNASNPVKHEVVGVGRRNDVLDRMAELGKITRAEAAEAKATTFDKKKVTPFRNGCANSEFPFLCDYALRTLQKTPSLGATPDERLDRVMRGGLTIKTQIDPKAQRQAEKRMRKVISAKDPVISTIVMLEPKTGLIRAMAQNRQVMGDNNKGKTWKGETFYNYAVDKSMGGADGVQGGSTFKMFVAAAALENGFGAGWSANVKVEKNWKGETFKSCSGPFVQGSDWKVTGTRSEVGNYDMWRGTAQSVNNYFAALEQAVGMCPVVEMATRLGLKSAIGENLVKKYQWLPSFTLGAVQVTPLSLVNAYATIANRGVRCDPVILKSITSSDGTTLAVPSANCKRVLDAGYADALNKIFQGPIYNGTLRSAQIPGYRLAGKTGTVPDNKSAWAVAYTPDLAAGAMISYDNNKQFRKFWNSRGSRYLKYVKLKYSGTWLTGFGADAGQKLLQPAMKQALNDIDEHNSFNSPDSESLNGEQVAVPSCSGMGVKSCEAALKEAGFLTTRNSIYDDSPANTLLYTRPRGQAGKGSLITLTISKGPKPEEPTAPPTAPTEPTTPPKHRR